MKRILLLLPLFMSMLTVYPIKEKNITLESSVVKIADGTFINADKIELIRKFIRRLLEFLLGEQIAHNQRKGKYLYDGKWYSIQSLAKIEQDLITLTSQKDIQKKLVLQELLTHAKADFIVQSNEFIESGRGSKNIMIVLIQEDCQKRNHPESPLLEWAKTKEGQESTMFEQQINSFNQYCHFLTDLVNFLFDLIHSCPKAEAQFKERVAKWSAVKLILPTVLKKAHVKSDQINEMEFLRYLKEKYLDSIAMDEITPPIIVPFLIEYIKHANSHT